MREIEQELPRPTNEMELREQLADRVEADPNRNPMEKETSFNLLGDEKFVRVQSAKPTIVKSILRHDYAALMCVTGQATDGSYASLTLDEMDWSRPAIESVHTVSAHLPSGVLTVKGKPRSTHTHSSIVNTPSDVASIQEAFAEQ